MTMSLLELTVQVYSWKIEPRPALSLTITSLAQEVAPGEEMMEDSRPHLASTWRMEGLEYGLEESWHW